MLDPFPKNSFGLYVTSNLPKDFTLRYFEESVELPIPTIFVPPKRTELSSNLLKSPFPESVKS